MSSSKSSKSVISSTQSNLFSFIYRNVGFLHCSMWLHFKCFLHVLGHLHVAQFSCPGPNSLFSPHVTEEHTNTKNSITCARRTIRLPPGVNLQPLTDFFGFIFCCTDTFENPEEGIPFFFSLPPFDTLFIFCTAVQQL